MAEYIDKKALITEIQSAVSMVLQTAPYEKAWFDRFVDRQNEIMAIIERQPAAEAEPVRHGHWIYEAHEEKANCRWNVTAECSECCDEKNEIWAGFFPGVPGCIAKNVAIDSAKTVKLSNFCPNCGARND